MRLRILTALTALTGLMVGALAASPPAMAAEPVPGGNVVELGPAGVVNQAFGGGPWAAVSPRSNNDVFGVRADTGHLERIKRGAQNSPTLDVFPEGVADQRILSLSNSGGSAAVSYLAVVTEDGLPHAWGGNGNVASPATASSVVNAFNAADLTSAAALGADGPPAEAVQVAAGVGVLGILLDDGRLGVLDAIHGYRILDFNAATLEQGEKVVEIDAFDNATDNGRALVLRLANGGALNWRWTKPVDAANPTPAEAQGTITIPQIADIAGRTGAAPGTPLPEGQMVPDPLIDIGGASNAKTDAVGVTTSGKVYSWAISTGNEVAENQRFSSQTPDPALVGDPVEAVHANTVFMVRTDAGELFWWDVAGSGSSGYVTGLNAKEIISITGGNVFVYPIFVPALAAVDAPTVASSGDVASPKVGDVLTGTPATFNKEGATLDSGWFAKAEGAEEWSSVASDEGDATKLTLTGSLKGSTVIFRTTATLDEENESSDSDPVGPVAQEDVAVDDPAGIAGTAKVGETLTGTPATFVGDPDDVVNEWLISDSEEDAENGDGETVPAGEGNALVLTDADHKGKWISFVSTATRGEGEEQQSASSASEPLGPVAPVDLAVDDAAGIGGVAKVGETLTGTPATFVGDPDDVVNEWLISDSEEDAENGDGETVPAGEGNALVLTDADHKGKWISFVSTATRGGDEVSSASAALGPVAAATVVTPPIVKTTPTVTLKVTKKPTMKKAGKATVTVSGGAVATGKVTVTVTGKVKKGKKAKAKTFTVSGVLKNGTVTVKIKKIAKAKGKWTLTAAYPGDTTHNLAVSKPVKIKVKKK